MKYRVGALLAVAMFVAGMFGLEWWARRKIEWAIATGWYMPQWFRVLYGITQFWHGFWPYITLIVAFGFLGIAASLNPDER